MNAHERRTAARAAPEPPPRWTVTIEMTDTATGEMVAWQERVPPDPDDPQWPWIYGWTDGNHSCDCNRWLEWERHHGRDPDVGAETNYTCNTGPNRYQVRIRNEDGDVLHHEPEP